MELRKVLFFTRGRGRGHAVADIEIWRELARIRQNVEVRFVSYGTGARTLREHGIPVIDLELPDANSIAATMVLAGRLVGRLQPDLVVAHEEAPALTAAKIFGKPAVFITDYFAETGTFSAESLWFADRVLFLDRKGVFREPASAKGRTRYVGPALRKFRYSRRDRERARRELGIEAPGPVVGVFPGSWTEARAPLTAALLRACHESGVALIWVAGDDAPLIRNAAKGRRHILVIEREWQIDRVMVCCDLAITKTNRMTVRELAALGIRTVSVDFGLNPADVRAIAPIHSNTTVAVEQLTRRFLGAALRRPEPRPARIRGRSCAAELAEMLV